MEQLKKKQTQPMEKDSNMLKFLNRRKRFNLIIVGFFIIIQMLRAMNV